MCGNLFYAPPFQVRRGGGKFCSDECRFRFMATHPESFPQTRGRRGRGGRRDDLGGRYFRSSWEANWARYLNWLKSIGEIVDWEYESETFEFKTIKRGNRFYTPDFKIANKDGSIQYDEVKGYMDAKSRTKLRRMEKYYPKVKIVLVDEDAYYAVAKQVRNFIPNWEREHR